MSTDISQITIYKDRIRENNYKIDKIRQENAEIENLIKKMCLHPTHITSSLEDEFGKVIGYRKQCTLCGEFLEK